MRLIDADEAARMVGFDEFTETLDMMQTIDAEPVRHAHWIDRDHGFQMCSNCGEECMEERDDLPFVTYNYCPYCGAKMDEEVSQ